MSLNIFPRKSLARRLSEVCLGAAFTLVVGSYAQEARAQWIVNDPVLAELAATKVGTDASNWLETVKSYTETYAHYQSEIAYWQSIYDKLSTFNLQMFAITNQFKRIADDYGVKDECPGVSGGLAGDITSALSSFVPNMGGDVIKQQQDLCRMIVMTKNHKYNSTVDYLTFMATQTQELSNIQRQRLAEVGSSPGKLESNTTETVRYAANLETARTNWQTDIAQADAQIDMLKQIQSILSRRAMNGEPSALGTLVNVTALKAAFTVSN
jgi:hypothetical protein